MDIRENATAGARPAALHSHRAVRQIQLAGRSRMVSETFQVREKQNMATTQRGYIFRKGGAWYLRYSDRVLGLDGQPVRRKLCRKLADFCDRYRSKKSVRPLADEFLTPINAGRVRPESTMSVAAFIENEYLPYVERNKRPSTLKGYKDMWKVHVKARIGDVTLRDFRPADGTALLADIVAHAAKPLSRRTTYHTKSFVSGVFAHAISQGWLDSDNPMRNARIPGGLRSPRETAAYDLETIENILALPELGDTARLAIAVAAFTGLRKGEIRGLRWEDYTGSELRVSRSVWNRHVTDPKTERSKAPVPVISRLASLLNSCRGAGGPIFRASNGQPLNLDNLARRVIVPVLAVNKLPWHGWHAFRRGLATNLHHLGADDKTIQGILRHSSLATTQAIYIKTVPADAVEAMRILDATLQQPAKLPN
jgi:integrase